MKLAERRLNGATQVRELFRRIQEQLKRRRSAGFRLAPRAPE
jgi:hypothetical protein